MEKSDKFKTRLFESLLTLIIGLAALVIATILIFFVRSVFEPKDKVEQLKTIEETTNDIQQALTPYESKDKLKNVVILEDFTNSIANNNPTKTFNNRLLVSGLFSQGYLYVKASIDNSSIENKGSIYTKMYVLSSDGLYQEFGGHLISSQSLDTPKSNDFTELLYQLSDIKYKKDFQDSDVEVISANWLKLLNMVGNHGILGFVSTVGNGKIIELSLYYECIQGTDCSISLLK